MGCRQQLNETCVSRLHVHCALTYTPYRITDKLIKCTNVQTDLNGQMK